MYYSILIHFQKSNIEGMILKNDEKLSTHFLACYFHKELSEGWGCVKGIKRFRVFPPIFKINSNIEHIVLQNDEKLYKPAHFVAC